MGSRYSFDNINNNINIISNYIDISNDLHYFDVNEIRIQYHFIDCINGSCTK